MILVDTSILIAYLRSHNTKLLARFQELDAVVSGSIRAEILHGSRNVDDTRRLLEFLAAFPTLGTPETLWDEVELLLFSLRKKSIQVPFNDAVIALLAVTYNVELWTADHDYEAIQSVETRLVPYSDAG